MAISYINSGTAVFSTSSVSPTSPTHAVGDILILTIGTKPDTAGSPSPTGYQSITAGTGGQGSSGIDTGPMRGSVWYRIATSTGSADDPGSISIASNNVSGAQIHVFRPSDITATIDIVGTNASDTTTGTAFTATMPTNIGLTVADMLLGFGVVPTDVGGGAQFASETVAATGMTTVSLTEIGEWASSTGQDMGAWIARGPVVTGTSTAAPVVSATASGTTTNIAGPIFLVRMREIPLTPATGSESTAITISDATSSILVTNPPLTANPDLSNTADGADGVVVSTSNNAGPNQFDSIVASPVYDASRFIRGTSSIRFVANSVSYCVWQASIGTSKANIYTRAYVWMDAFPSSTALIINLVTPSGSAAGKIQITATGAWRVVNGAGGVSATGTTVVPTGQWVRFELDATGISGTTGTLTARIYTTPDQTTATETIGASAQTVNDLVSRVWFGPNASNTNSMWFDDVAVSFSGPVGPPATGGGTGNDSSAITISESSSIFDPTASTPVSGTESSAITISESSAVAIITSISATDTAAITISASSSVSASTPPTPTLSNVGVGTSGTSVSTSNTSGPNQFDAVTKTGTGAVTFDSLYAPHSSTSVKYVGGTGTAYTTWSTAFGTNNNAYMRTYLYIDAAPSANARIMSASGASGLGGAIEITTGRVLRLLDHNGSVVATGTTTIPVGNWVRVEFDIFGHASAGTMSGRLFLGPDSSTVSQSISASALNTGGALTSVSFGISSTANVNYWLGEMVVSNVGAMEPTLMDPDFIVVVADMQPGSGVNPPPSVVAGKITALSPAPNYVLMPGDLANDGTATQYGFFDTMYGALSSVIYPVPGNHDWVPGNLTAYDAEMSNDHTPTHYYSFDTTTGWHVIGLESDAANVGAPSIGTTQYNWLAADLAANSGKPIIAFWHHSRWSEGTNTTDPGGTGDSTVMADVWNLLRDYGADLVFTGHTHSYQRFPKFGKTGTADSAGIREFVVGTGGSGLFTLNATGRRTEVDSYQSAAYDQLNSQWFGYLKLWVTRDGYSWQFISQNAGVLDSGGPVAVNNVAGTVIVSGSETPAITISESNTLAVSSSTTDTAAVTITEASGVAVTQPTSDTSAITISETSAIVVQISANDTCAVTIGDASSSQSSISRTDSCAITISEGTSQITNSFSSSESVAVTIAETSGASASVVASETTAINVADSSSLAINTAISATDTCAATISEGTSQVSVAQPTSDTTAVSIAESRQLASTSTSTETCAITISESSQVVITQFVSTNDSSAVTISESSSPTVAVSASDTAAITIADVPIPSVTAPGSESVALTITENSSVFVSLSTSDTCAITIADASAPTVQFSTTDTTAITIDDQAGFTAKNISVSDTAAITIDDQAALVQTQFVSATDTTALTISELSAIFYSLSASDSCAISVADSSSLQVSGGANVSASDTTAITISESSNIATTQAQSGSENISVTINETSGVSGTTTTTESTALTINETSSVFATVSASDACAVSIAESSNASQQTNLPGNDTTSITIAESSSIQVSGVFTVTSTDICAVTISESTQLAQTVQLAATDNGALSVDETSSIFGTMTSVDSTAIQVADTSIITKNLSATDSVSITISETSSITPIDALYQLSSSEDIAISIVEHISIVNPFAEVTNVRAGGHVESRRAFASEIDTGIITSKTSVQTGHSGGRTQQQVRVE